MANVAFCLPNEGMIEETLSVSSKYSFNVVSIEIVTPQDREEKINKLKSKGADILIARGGTALLIKRITNLPLVSIRLTSQELAILIIKAKKFTNKALPLIGIIALTNMIPDTSSFEELFGVSLNLYITDSYETLRSMVENAARDKVDIIIGDGDVCKFATNYDIPSIFMSSGKESLEEACELAQHIAYAIDLEKQNSAEWETIFDSAFNHIIHINPEGIIKKANASAKQLLDTISDHYIDSYIWNIFPALTREILSPALNNGEEIDSFKLTIQQDSYTANISPILVEQKKPYGAIITISRRSIDTKTSMSNNTERSLLGYSQVYTLNAFTAKSASMKEILKSISRYAQLDAPILLSGPLGTEKQELAKCIHNIGDHREKPFINFDCEAYSVIEIEQLLFEKDGFLKQNCTVFLNNIDCLSKELQHKLLSFLRGTIVLSQHFNHSDYLQIISATSKNLLQLVQEGKFSGELFFLINILSINIPPLSERPEDIISWANYYLDYYQKHTRRHVYLTKGAWAELRRFNWPGNCAQVENIIRKIVYSSRKRNIDELIISNLLLETIRTNHQVEDQSHNQVVIYKSQEAVLIEELLSKYKNKTRVAKELGISTTTLWRRIKKYNL